MNLPSPASATAFHPTYPPERNRHRFACFAAGSVFCLIIAGGLVTSNDAGLAVPDWPLSYGMLMPPMVGGIFYEHGHRMVATFVGLITVILAFWTSAVESRQWVRRLAWINLAAVITQGLLGGITVLYFLPPAVSMAHASLAQAFFCLTLTIAVVTGRKWRDAEPGIEIGAGQASVRGLSLWVVLAIYAQIILGAGNRHNAIGIASHVAGAVAVGIMAGWLVGSARKFYPAGLSRQAHMLAMLVLLQAVVGIVTLLVKIGAASAVQPTPDRIWTSTAHVALGALTLATAVVFSLRVWRRSSVFGAAAEVPAVLPASELNLSA